MPWLPHHRHHPDAAAVPVRHRQRDWADPLQNAEIVAAIANGGIRMTPYLVKSIQGRTCPPGHHDPDGRAGRTADVGGHHAADDRVENVPGRWEDRGVQIASRPAPRSTATRRSRRRRTLYIAFRAGGQPQVPVAVVVENARPGWRPRWFGAAPVGRAVIAAALGGGGGRWMLAGC